MGVYREIFTSRRDGGAFRSQPTERDQAAAGFPQVLGGLAWGLRPNSPRMKKARRVSFGPGHLGWRDSGVSGGQASLGGVHQAAEGSVIADGQIGQHLTVDIYPRLV